MQHSLRNLALIMDQSASYLGYLEVLRASARHSVGLPRPFRLTFRRLIIAPVEKTRTVAKRDATPRPFTARLNRSNTLSNLKYANNQYIDLDAECIWAEARKAARRREDGTDPGGRAMILGARALSRVDERPSSTAHCGSDSFSLTQVQQLDPTARVLIAALTS
jgi:hypothetical protein